MSSRIDAIPQGSRRRRPLRAARRARLAPYVSGAFGLIAVGVLLAFLYQTGAFTTKPKPVEEAVVPADHVTVSTSTITGLDSQQRPYSISAKTAIQDKDEPKFIKLNDVSGATNRKNGEAITFQSQKGLYNSDVKTLDLDTEVVIQSKDRFTARMDKAHVVVGEKRLTSDVPVQVQLSNGTINANGVQITNDGNNILFLNGVKAHFGSSKSQGDSTP
ncbi:LPS export ABC transporter periplasmic protein LptC [Taklimakanibacter albus]|uniref:LPS export ABC transporter periplasmic protein LptC n=1 Tax=Taklimakanibacter albus TaxID=2800327 RepID=A0ACC5REF9_9HYPH|nr:LPS export ABC transporter periplasmic protein LptC [Aestuariivirga sp. YIM B02566]MBK1871091.1 LPS export ABC transporter periplasmic protein LptC [Aestuariivirga sp. YIM B02566]